jgi:hypothetical protein
MVDECIKSLLVVEYGQKNSVEQPYLNPRFPRLHYLTSRSTPHIRRFANLLLIVFLVKKLICGK